MARRLRIYLLLLPLLCFAPAAFCGCAGQCQTALKECRYECQRQFQLCQLKTTDTALCHDELGDCDLNCDSRHASCSGAWW